MKHLVESLLHLAAIERNEFDYAKTKLNVHEIIEEAISTVEMILLEKGGEIKTKLEASKTHVYADQLHLSNAIVNLLSNAIKYSKEKVLIELSTQNSGHEIYIEIKDNGIGIPLKYQKYILY